VIGSNICSFVIVGHIVPNVKGLVARYSNRSVRFAYSRHNRVYFIRMFSI